MIMSKKDMNMVSRILILLALFSVGMAAIGYLGTDIWLASTQWLLTATVFGVFSIYLKI